MINIITNGEATGPIYIGWSPQVCSIGFSAAQAASTKIILKVVSVPSGGSVNFSNTAASSGNTTLSLTIPSDGSQIPFYIFGSKASTVDQDVTIEGVDGTTGAILCQRTLMVRIRKNANTLTNNERDRFLTAFVKLNLTQGIPSYQNFLDMHNADANTEIHSTTDIPRCSFLLWHRAYILDMERQLQKTDASVALPYWKFDAPAPNLFIADFLGADTGTGSLQFSPTNPMISWTILGKIGVIRKPQFNVQTSAANIPGQVPINNDSNTMALGGPGADFLNFRSMEDNPHGYAHVSFSSPAPITNIFTAPQDPIFFLLHCNIDRLWALWQAVNHRYDIVLPQTYPNAGAFTPGHSAQNIGDYLNDTMWPWNGVTTGTRPPTAPGGNFPQTSFKSTPSAVPLLWEMIDYQGYFGGAPSYADYDVITFTPQTKTVTESNLEKFRLNVGDAVTKNLELAHQFRISKTDSEMNLALSNLTSIDPKDGDLVNKAYSLVKDKNVHKNLRLKALEKLTNFLFTSEPAVKDMIEILRDEEEPVEIRRAALQSLSAISFSSPAFNAQLPAFKNALRELLGSHDPELLQTAVAQLAAYKDEGIQQILLDDLKDHTKALVPDEKAIQLLGLDIRAEHYPVIRDILAKSQNSDVMIEAIIVLSGDPASRDLILRILMDKKTDNRVRLACISALNSMDPEKFQPTLKSIISDDNENSEIRIASLNTLSLHQNLSAVHRDKPFTQTLEGLKLSDNKQLQKMSLQFLKTKN